MTLEIVLEGNQNTMKNQSKHLSEIVFLGKRFQGLRSAPMLVQFRIDLGANFEANICPNFTAEEVISE